ncbi:MAG: PEP-CTERM sorting domain-containing protein [Planctomycetes bacterium]|nr:PEP-CTERM sorting domain-containing protein [Planctomycetota bacterium]
MAGTNANNNAPNFVGIGTEGAWAEPADSDLGAVLVFDTRLSDDERVGVEHFLALAFALDGFDATPAQQAAGLAALDGFLVIPEPGSLTLFILGIGGLMSVGFRRRRRAIR